MPEQSGSTGTETKREKSQIRGFWVGTIAFVLGFGLWLVDCIYCDALRDVRETVGFPWGWLLQLHGWWHIATAVGAGKFIEVVRNI